MWLYMFAGVLLILGLGGGFLFGGIFTIVLVPVAVVIAGSAFVFAMWHRASEGAAGGSVDAHPSVNRPLPHAHREDSGRAPTSPEGLADARRVQQ